MTLATAARAAEEEFVNAGVLPYTTAPGEITVLLGFDSVEGHWSDFVGTCTPGENPRQTAGRQFAEETRGAYQTSDIEERLRDLAPVVAGNTRIFLLEVPEVSATQLGLSPRCGR